MSTTPALVTAAAGAALEPGTIERRDLRDDDVLIDVKFAGICHSDIHQVREEWGEAIFPMVPGHEIAGIVSAVGAGVTKYKVGDRVGVGCMVDSCGECEFCKDGEEQYCTKGAVMTYNGKGYDGETDHGRLQPAGRRLRALRRRHPRRHRARRRGAAAVRRHHDVQPAASAGAPAPARRSPSSAWAAWATWRSSSPPPSAPRSPCCPARSPSRRTASASARRTTSPRRTRRRSPRTPRAASTSSSTRSAPTCRWTPTSALLRPLGALVNVGLPDQATTRSRPSSVVGGSRALAGSNIGGIAADPGDARLLRRARHRGGRSRRSAPTRSTRPTTASSARDVRYRFVIDTATIKA